MYKLIRDFFLVCNRFVETYLSLYKIFNKIPLFRHQRRLHAYREESSKKLKSSLQFCISTRADVTAQTSEKPRSLWPREGPDPRGLIDIGIIRRRRHRTVE